MFTVINFWWFVAVLSPNLNSQLHCFHVLGNQPPASFGLTARQFLYVMSRIQSPLCTYCRRWPCSGHLDSCWLCRCCVQISQFGRDQSLTEQRYLDLVARLTVILGELAAHSSWPWELGRSTESQSRPQDHRRVRSSSRSSSDHSPLRRRIGCQIAREERHEETREARSRNLDPYCEASPCSQPKPSCPFGTIGSWAQACPATSSQTGGRSSSTSLQHASTTSASKMVYWEQPGSQRSKAVDTQARQRQGWQRQW